MSSPFPGMDPYLEGAAHWSDFHFTFINYWREAIAEQLPEEYEANIGERVYLVEVDPDTRKLIYPDVAVSEGRISTASAPVVATAVATLEPVTIPLETVEGPREAYIEILHRPDRDLVGVLELLSPANKHDPGRTEYLSKRNAVIRQSVHLVELDLLLGGQRLPLRRPLPPADYYYLLSRGEARPDCQVFHWNLGERLPRLPVPLRPPHPDLTIDLAQVFATAYDRGRFGRRLTYRQPCPAPIRPEQQRWVAEVLASKLGS
jgi:hypothetical protein